MMIARGEDPVRVSQELLCFLDRQILADDQIAVRENLWKDYLEFRGNPFMKDVFNEILVFIEGMYGEITFKNNCWFIRGTSWK